MGMFPSSVETFSSDWWFQVSLNVITPFILIGLGFILPMIAKKTNGNSGDTLDSKNIA